MARDPIQDVQDKLETAFTLLSKVIVSRANRLIDFAPKTSDHTARFTEITALVEFHPRAQGEKDITLPCVLKLPSNVFPVSPNPNHSVTRQGMNLLYGTLAEIKKNVTGSEHENPINLRSTAFCSEFGFGINIPISERATHQLEELAGRMLAQYSLESVAMHINGVAPIQVPTHALIDMLLVRKEESESTKANPSKIKHPEEYDLDVISKLLVQAREKSREEERAARNGRGE